jgi:hypothetical protein
MTDRCLICGGINDSTPTWQTYCLSCGRETWGAAVVASFIKLAQDYQDKATELETVVLALRKRVEELERPD